MNTSPLARLGDLGQSVWIDDISRSLISDGTLDALIAGDGVCGVTSNPTLFHKAITESTAYDHDIRAMAAQGVGPEGIREDLILADINSAADTLGPVFEATGGRDGWVSLEVDPALAHDTQKTVAEVIRIRGRVERPNVMIKVPATRQGVAAVRDLTALGCSINITLIFSLERYRQVIEAYMAGLEELRTRRASGEAVPALSEVHSVASFFVSRVDTAVDKRLEALAADSTTGRPTTCFSLQDLERLRGKAAVSNAKQAYRVFQETFVGARWEQLAADKANPQRPLWASTGTKDPRYSDILYVQELIGARTVSTMPQKTMEAFRDHGRAEETLTVGTHAASDHLKSIADAGVDMEEVAADLEQNGVRTFATSYEGLLTAVQGKMIAAAAKP